MTFDPVKGETPRSLSGSATGDPNDDPVTFHRALGDRIRRRRTALALSQQKLAQRIGITFQQVQKYEKGVNRPHGLALYRLSRELDCSLDWLVAGEDRASPADGRVLPEGAPTSSAAMFQAYEQLPEHQRQAVKMLLLSLVKSAAPAGSADGCRDGAAL